MNKKNPKLRSLKGMTFDFDDLKDFIEFICCRIEFKDKIQDEIWKENERILETLCHINWMLEKFSYEGEKTMSQLWFFLGNLSKYVTEKIDQFIIKDEKD